MATTWPEVNERLSFFLDDRPEGGELAFQFPHPLRIEAWNWAQSIFGNHTLRERRIELGVADDRTSLAPLDLVEVGFMHDLESAAISGFRQSYTRRSFAEGDTTRVDNIAEDWSYWLWDEHLHLGRAPAENTIVLYYFASWPNVEYTIKEDGLAAVTQPHVLVPKWAELPLSHLVAATVLAPHAITASMTNEFKIKIDSGTPLDNPREQEAERQLWWYNSLIALYRPQLRAVGARR
jgi:hypothetical protein